MFERFKKEKKDINDLMVYSIKKRIYHMLKMDYRLEISLDVLKNHIDSNFIYQYENYSKESIDISIILDNYPKLYSNLKNGNIEVCVIEYDSRIMKYTGNVLVNGEVFTVYSNDLTNCFNDLEKELDSINLDGDSIRILKKKLF